MSALREITTPQQLADLLQLTPKALRYWAFIGKPSSLYTEFMIPKKSGGARVIHAPSLQLKKIQWSLLKLLDELFTPRNVVHGYVRGRSILTNAIPHADQRFVLNVDLQDFFPSINFGRVRGALMARPFELQDTVATLIARLTCFENSLPQGAPTSPCLSNMVCMKLDSEMLRLTRSFGCKYTRYADDITISTHKRRFPLELAQLVQPPYGTFAKISAPLNFVVEANGFTVNDDKTRLFNRQNSQRVTGLVVNESPNVDRRFVRNIRAMIHRWRQQGIASVEECYEASYATRHRAPYKSPPDFRQHLVGKIRFLAMVKGPTNPQYIRFAKQCRTLDPTLFAHALDGEERVERSVWVVECEETGVQGTAFFVEGLGLVTCQHVLGPKSVVFHPSDLTKRFPVQVKVSDKHLDLAILSTSAVITSSLLLSADDDLVRNQRVLLVGYPNFGVGDTLYRVSGTHTMNKVRSGVTYHVPSVRIGAGNSGGPLMDENYRVVGVAARGVKNLLGDRDADPDAHATISVRHLKELALRIPPDDEAAPRPL